MDGAREKLAFVSSDAADARAAATALAALYGRTPVAEADVVVALGGDGFLLQTLHEMLERGKLCPVFGMNRGTVGFLMNDWRIEGLRERVNRAKAFSVVPLRMAAVTITGERIVRPAINEVSLLRETRQTAWIEVSVDRSLALTLLFDPEHALDERISMEQFAA